MNAVVTDEGKRVVRCAKALRDAMLNYSQVLLADPDAISDDELQEICGCMNEVANTIASEFEKWPGIDQFLNGGSDGHSKG